MQEQVEYMECLKAQKNMAEECTNLAKSYLMCRMDACVPKFKMSCCFNTLICVLVRVLYHVLCRGLMARQSLQELGLDGIYRPENVDVVQDKSRSSQGFVAGVRSSGDR